MYVLPPCIDCMGEKEIVAPELDTCVYGYECGPRLSPLPVQRESGYLGCADVHPHLR